MKIRPSYIFTVLGNAMDNIDEGYIDKNQTVHIFLNHDIISRCVDVSENISNHYTITAVFCRTGLIDIYMENDEEEADRIELIDSDKLFEYLDFTESESLFDTMCKMIYTNAPEI